MADPKGLQVKPPKWNINPAEVDPKWQWAWRDLKVCIPFWEGSGTGANTEVFNYGKMRSGRIDTATSVGPIPWKAVGEGYAKQFNADGLSLRFPADDVWLAETTDPVSFMAVVRRQSAVGDYTGTASDQGWIIQWAENVNGTGLTKRFGTGSSFVEMIATTGAGSASANIAFLGNDRTEIVQGTWNGNEGGRIRLYRNGFLVQTSSRSGSLVNNSGGTPDRTFSIGSLNVSDGSGGHNAETFSGDIILVYGWRPRELTPEEMDMLSKDPFGPIRRRRRVYERNRVHVDHG
jgi:hypothetical protein